MSTCLLPCCTWPYSEVSWSASTGNPRQPGTSEGAKQERKTPSPKRKNEADKKPKTKSQQRAATKETAQKSQDHKKPRRNPQETHDTKKDARETKHEPTENARHSPGNREAPQETPNQPPRQKAAREETLVNTHTETLRTIVEILWQWRL